MDDATHLLPLCHCHPVVVKTEPQESEYTENIIDQHEVKTETSDLPLEDCLIQPKIEISDDRELFHLQIKSEENTAFYSHIIDHPYATCQALEGSVTEESENIRIENHIASFTSISTSEDYLIEHEPKSIGETDFSHIQIQPEVDASEAKDHHTQPSQDIDPLNNILVPPRDWLYSCELCSFKHSSKRYLARHKIRHHPPSARFQCKRCEYSSTDKSSLIKHLRTHSAERSYACDVCNYKSNTKVNLTGHMLSHAAKRFQCTKCDYRCSVKHYLTKHMRSHFKEWSFVCHICNKKYKHNSSLFKHLLIHSTKKRFQCSKCDFSRCKSRYELDAHLRTHEVDGEHICEICARAFVSRSSLTQHMLSHSPIVSSQPEDDFTRKQERLIQAETVIGIPGQSEDIASTDNDHHTDPIQNTEPLSHSLVPPRDLLYSSENCSYQGNSKYHFASHKLSHSLQINQVRQCSVFLTRCDSTCSSSNTLPSSSKDNDHEPGQDTDPLNNILVPPRDLLHSCDICSFKSKSKHNLAQHKRRHHPPSDRFQCDHCEYSAKEKRYLSNHLKSHSEEGSYACNICGNLTSNLSKHMLTHSKKKRFRCKYCDYRCKSRQEIEIHVRTHELEGWHICEICAHVCVSRSSLTQHMLSHSTATSNQPEEDSNRKQERTIQAETVIDIPEQSEDIAEISSKDNDHHSEPIQNTKPLSHSLVPPRDLIYSCELCSYQGSKRNLARHKRRQHTSSVRFQCHYCEHSTKAKQHLYSHLKTHPEERAYACNICTYKSNKANLASHMLTHSIKTRYRCKNCDYRCESRQEIEIHVRTHEVDGPQLCEICAHVCPSRSSLTQHLLSHSSIVSNQPEEDFNRKQERLFEAEIVIGVLVQSEDIAEIPGKDINPIQNTEPLGHSLVPPRELFACKLCTFKSKSNSSLSIHMSTHTTGKKQFQCIHCGYTCNDKQDIDIHVTTMHSGERPFACGECSFKSVSSSELKLHNLVHSSARKMFKCTECDFTTNYMGVLTTHIKTHSDERQYVCGDCSFTCATTRELSVHKKVHTTKRKTYKCTECDFTTDMNLHLIIHLRTHSGERQYVCGDCSFTCATVRELNSHKTTKTYKCRKCDYMSCGQHELDNHIMRMHGENPYACDMCSYVGGSSVLLVQHKRMYH